MVSYKSLNRQPLHSMRPLPSVLRAGDDFGVSSDARDGSALPTSRWEGAIPMSSHLVKQPRESVTQLFRLCHGEVFPSDEDEGVAACDGDSFGIGLH